MQNKLAKFNKYINKNLAKNFIYDPKSLIEDWILFIKKINELLQMYVLYLQYYLTNILIYSKNTKENWLHLCCILQKLRDAGLYTKIKKVCISNYLSWLLRIQHFKWWTYDGS